MIFPLRTAALVTSVLALTACGGSETSNFSFAPATYDGLDSSFQAREANMSPFPTTFGERPDGSVSYNGEIRITPNIPGGPQDYLGRTLVTVDFPDNAVSGSVGSFTAERGFVTSDSLALNGGTFRTGFNGQTQLAFTLSGDIADSQGNSLGFSNDISGGVRGREAETVYLEGGGTARNNNSRNGATVPVSIALIAERP